MEGTRSLTSEKSEAEAASPSEENRRAEKAKQRGCRLLFYEECRAASIEILVEQ